MDEILALYGHTKDRAGFIRCPFHAGDHTASLKIYKGSRGWSCFGCHAGGTVIDFVMKSDQLQFADAVRQINSDFNLGLLTDKPRSFNAFFKKNEQQLKDQQEYKTFKADLEAETALWEGWIDEHWQLYQDAISKPTRNRTNQDWWHIAEQQYFQPLELQELQSLQQRKEVSFFEWQAEKRGKDHAE